MNEASIAWCLKQSRYHYCMANVSIGAALVGMPKHVHSMLHPATPASMDSLPSVQLCTS